MFFFCSLENQSYVTKLPESIPTQIFHCELDTALAGLGKVDKMALPPFEEQKLCQRTSHAQFQITLSTAALSYHTLEKSQITLRGSTATLRLI